MSLLTRQQLDASLKQGRIHSLYLLLGDETFLRDEAARAIAADALKNTLIREFNESRFSLLRGNALEAIAAAEQLPMMSDRRVVFITDFGKLREADEEALLRYVERPADSSVVIFVTNELDKRRRLTKTLLDRAAVIEFASVSDAEARAWAKNRLRILKVNVDEQTLGEIITLVGTDIRTLQSELDKLATAALGTNRITSDMVNELIGRSRELSNFDLTDHLIAKRRGKSLEILYRLLEDGAEPVMLIGLIAGNYRRLALAKDLLAKGGKEAVFRTVRMPWKLQDNYLSIVRRSTEAELVSGLQRIAAADLAVKTSLATPRLQVEMLVCELTS